MTMIAVMALMAGLSASHPSLVRASRITTSATIASAQMERYRAIKYTEIRLGERISLLDAMKTHSLERRAGRISQPFTTSCRRDI